MKKYSILFLTNLLTVINLKLKVDEAKEEGFQACFELQNKLI